MLALQTERVTSIVSRLAVAASVAVGTVAMAEDPRDQQESSTVTTARILLDEKFENLDRWHLEGLADAISIIPSDEGGVNQMRLACEGSRQGGIGAMAFLKQDFPDNIAVDFDLVVESHNGLLITFLAMQGIHGEDAITGVPARTGIFNDYISKDATTRSYHVSVCRYNDKGEHTGVSNWRRNPGIHMMASGKDLCTEANRSYHITILKQGPRCRIEVDGEVGAEFVDPQELPGPIPTAGKIGFRAIGANATFRVSNLKVSVREPVSDSEAQP